MKTIDVRGLSCPEPVIQTREAIQSGESAIQILVDSPTARENVVRFAEGQGFRSAVEEENGTFTITLGK